MVVAIDLLDALLMKVYAMLGTLVPLTAVAYGAAGSGTTVLFAIVVHMGLHRRMGGAWFTTLQLMTACGLIGRRPSWLPGGRCRACAPRPELQGTVATPGIVSA